MLSEYITQFIELSNTELLNQVFLRSLQHHCKKIFDKIKYSHLKKNQIDDNDKEEHQKKRSSLDKMCNSTWLIILI